MDASKFEDHYGTAAMRKTGKAGLAQVTIGGREWLVAITPLGAGLVMGMLRYADELRNAGWTHCGRV